MALFLGFSHKGLRGVGYLCIPIDYHGSVLEFIYGIQYDISHGKHTGLPPGDKLILLAVVYYYGSDSVTKSLICMM